MSADEKRTRLKPGHAQVYRPLRMSQEFADTTQTAAEAQGVKWAQWMREAAEQRLARDARKAKRTGLELVHDADQGAE